MNSSSPESKLFFTVVCSHTYTNTREIVNGSFKFKHTALYVVRVVDKLNHSYCADFFSFVTKNKAEAFLVHKIFNDNKYALLYANSPNETLKKCANWKISVCPNISVKVKHIYKNRIPKLYLFSK